MLNVASWAKQTVCCSDEPAVVEFATRLPVQPGCPLAGILAPCLELEVCRNNMHVQSRDVVDLGKDAQARRYRAEAVRAAAESASLARCT